MKYYGQNAEDFLLEKVFNKKNGYFVEVGCIDGRVYSNTLSFEQKGWKGMCIEAHNDYVPLLLKNRPGSTVVHCAVGDKNEEQVTFYSNARGSLSSLDKSTEERWNKDFKPYFHGFVEQKVAERTLTSIFDEYKVGPIDFLSLDIEGYEVPALRGLDFTKHRPHMMVIETDSPAHTAEINDILKPNGYHLLLQKEANLYYSIDKRDREKLINHFTTITLTRAGHPVDGTSDSEIQFVVDTRVKEAPRQGILERIKSRIKNMFS